jgi:hypothetical protein
MATSVEEALHELLNKGPFEGIRQCKLIFNIDGIQNYETVFKIKCTLTKLEVYNSCVKIFYNSENIRTGLNPYEGAISANSDVKNCFTPVLKSHRHVSGSFAAASATASGYTTIDVLQILKTKIGLLFPPKGPISITDVARIRDVYISPFNIIRGGNAIYEKYGYRSEFIEEVKKIIEEAYKDQFFVKTYLKDTLFDFIRFTNERLGSHLFTDGLDSTTLLVDIMRQFSMEDEQAYHDHLLAAAPEGTDISPISDWLVHYIGKYRLWVLHQRQKGSSAMELIDFMSVTTIGRPTAWMFTLDATSPEWRASDARMRFLDFREIGHSSSSARRGRRTRRYRKRH